jgi:hypothetical protein
VLDLGWEGRDIDFERGEFDALAHGVGEGPVLVMEAKARATGPDSLETMVRAWLASSESPGSSPDTNAGRKGRELRRLCGLGPVAVWLVANGARWTMTATGDIRLEAAEPPAKATVLRPRRA